MLEELCCYHSKYFVSRYDKTDCQIVAKIQG